ncbi:MAG: ATP-binding protein [Spirochaetales bacterium]|nr:ATP-binding protein [Spirochaetales bacterium]
MVTILNELKSIDTFSNIPLEDLQAVAEICRPAHYAPRSVIAQEGVDADGVFALTVGSVGIWVDYGSDKADLLAVREAPCLVGEMSVVDQLPRSATIVAGSPVAGYIIEAADFRQLLLNHGSVALGLIVGISRLVRRSNDSFVNELRGRNEELLAANEELRNAHRQLVRQERLSSLGKFSSMIIHDLRNPLSVIKGYADMLELKLGGNGELEKYVGQIRREASRLSGLTGEWLDYSRGEIRLAYGPVMLDSLFSELKESMEPRMRSKEIQAEWNNEFHETALIDKERLIRVLINLVNNSIKACRRGGRVEVSAHEENGMLRFIIRDNGVGMDLETLQHLFEPFYSSAEGGGTGLGMHIVKTVMEAHGGEVEVDSVLGKGTEVRLRIPIRP